MNLNILFKDFPKICRLCLSSDELRPMLQIEVLNTFSAITHIEVEEDDKLPENVCNNCVKQLEDMSAFIDKCKQNHEVLRSVMLNEFEKKYTEEQYINYNNDFCDGGGGDDDNVKSECAPDGNPEFLEVNIKEEIVSEVDVPNFLNKDDCPMSYENCSENLSKTSFEKPAFANHTRIHKYSDYKKFLCNICGKNFRKNAHLDRHLRIHSDIKPYECKECGKHFGQSNDLKRHLLTHTREKVFQCSQCKKTFHQKSCLDNHVLTHSSERNFECNVCDKKFTVKVYLEAHAKTHTGIKPFQCSVCDKQFYQKSGLNTHILTHTGEKPYKCTSCEKTFIQSNRLKEHLKTHSGEKPFVCTYCNKAFAYNSTLKVHLRQHTGETPFVCTFCNRGFHDSSNLRRHINRIHENERTSKNKNSQQN